MHRFPTVYGYGKPFESGPRLLVVVPKLQSLDATSWTAAELWKKKLPTWILRCSHLRLLQRESNNKGKVALAATEPDGRCCFPAF